MPITIEQLRNGKKTLACARDRHGFCYGVVYSKEQAGDQFPWRELGPCACSCHEERT